MTAPIVNSLPYDKTSPDSILAYAQRLKWKTFSQVLEEDKNLSKEQKDIIKRQFSMPKNKWWYGHFIEENFFYYDKNSNNEADFPEAWVELKVSPYEKNSKWLRAKERLVLTIIKFVQYTHIQNVTMFGLTTSPLLLSSIMMSEATCRNFLSMLSEPLTSALMQWFSFVTNNPRFSLLPQ